MNLAGQLPKDQHLLVGRFRYAHILHISLMERYLQATSEFKARINEMPGLPKAIYIVLIVIFYIQFVGPSFALDSNEIWDPNSTFTVFLRYFGCLWQGWQSTRVVTSLVFAVIEFLVEVMQIFLTLRFRKRRVASKTDGFMVLLIGKYLRVIFGQMILVGIPMAIKSLVDGVDVAVSAALVAFTVFDSACYFVDIYLISGRLTMENNPNHEWHASHVFMQVVVQCLCALLSTCLSVINKNGKVVCLGIMVVLYAGFSIWCFIKSPLVKRMSVLWLSTMSMTAALLSLFSLILHFVGKVSPAVVIVIFVILVVVCYLVFMLINKGMVSKIMHVFQQCEETPDDADEIMEMSWRSAFSFISAVHIVFQQWPPFLLTWKPFHWAMQQWPENHELCLLWARIVVLFPKEEDIFRWLLGTYSNMKPDFARSVYVNQMAHIAGSRVSGTNQEILHEIGKVERVVEHIRALHQKLWENILQKNVDGIWGEADAIFHYTDKLQRMFDQMVDAYPNNPDVVKHYCKFLLNIRADMRSYIEWSRKLNQLKHGQHLRLDSAIQAAKDFLPEIQQLCADAFTNTPSDKEKHEHGGLDKDRIEVMDDNVFQVHQMKLGLQNMIEHTKVARVWMIIIILVIGTALAIGVFVWFSQVYEKYFVRSVLAKAKFLSVFNGLGNDLIYAAVYSVSFPLFSATDTNLLNINDDSLTRRLAPVIYECGNLEAWWFNRTKIDTITTNVRDQIAGLSGAFADIPDSEGLDAVYNSIFVDIVRDQLTLQDVAVKLILNVAELGEGPLVPLAYYTSVRFLEVDAIMVEALPTFNQIPPTMVDVHTRDMPNVTQKMNEQLVLCLFVVLVLISLPFVLAQFSLTIQSRNISHLFTSLPNTAVREVLENQNKMAMNEKEDKGHNSTVEQAAMLTASFVGVSDTQLILLFVLSLVMIVGGSLYLYFSYLAYADGAAIDLNRIMVFYKPIYTMAYVMFRLIRAAQMLATGIDIGLEELASPITHIFLANQSLVEIKGIITNDLWGENPSVTIWYESGATINRFDECAPYNNPYDVCHHLTSLEYLLVSEMLEFLDNVVTDMQKLIRELAVYFLMTHPPPAMTSNGQRVPLITYEKFAPLLYMFTNYARENRFTVFVNQIQDSLISKYDRLHYISSDVTIAVCVLQVLILGILILVLLLRSKEIRRILKLFSFVNPTVVLQNSHIVGVLTTGRLKNIGDNNNFRQAEKIIEKITEGVLLCTKDLVISDVNAAFMKLVGLPSEEIIEHRVTDIIKNVNGSANSMESVILKLHDALKGNGPTVFMNKVEIQTPDGEEKSVMLHVICLTEIGTATEANADEIAGVAMVIEDLTAQKKKDEETREEQDRRAEMLLRVLPAPIVDEIQQGSETISFAVQSASIGCIRVRVKGSQMNEELGGRFSFLNEVFKIFDGYISEYEQLSRVRTFSDTYVYAGGVFGSVNKPDKHAEEATRFALQVIKGVPAIEAQTGQKIEVVIGLNTGGPLVAGVVSLNRPFFQLIGPAIELADQMKLTGVPNKLHITRSVYELIYAYNFQVSDRGDVHIGSNRTLHTYLVVP